LVEDCLGLVLARKCLHNVELVLGFSRTSWRRPWRDAHLLPRGERVI
jgi:hypothetical protein